MLAEETLLTTPTSTTDEPLLHLEEGVESVFTTPEIEKMLEGEQDPTPEELALASPQPVVRLKRIPITPSSEIPTAMDVEPPSITVYAGEEVEEIPVTPEIEDMFPYMDMTEAQLSPVPGWEQAETASIEDLETNKVNDSGVSDLDTTIAKKPTANNGLEEVIEPFALPQQKKLQSRGRVRCDGCNGGGETEA